MGHRMIFFSLMSLVKDYIFSQKPTSFVNLERVIMEGIGMIDRKILETKFLSMKLWKKVCRTNTGGHV